MPSCDRRSKTFHRPSPKTRTDGDAVFVPQRAIVMREQADERGLPGAVGTDDGGMFARVDGEREAVEDAAVVFDDRRVAQL